MSKSHTPQPGRSSHTKHESLDQMVESIMKGQARADTSLEMVQRAVPAKLRGAVSLKKVSAGRTATSTPYPRPPPGERSKSRLLLIDEPASRLRSLELSKQSQLHLSLDHQHSEKLRLLEAARVQDLQQDMSVLQSLKQQQRAVKYTLLREKQSKAAVRVRLEQQHREDVKRRSVLAAKEVLEEKRVLREMKQTEKSEARKAEEGKELVKRMLPR